MSEIKKWIEDNKYELLFSICLAGTIYCTSKMSYIFGRNCGYLEAISDVLGNMGEVTKF